MHERKRAEDRGRGQPRRLVKKSAIAAGTSSCRAAVPGSDSVAARAAVPRPEAEHGDRHVSSEAPAAREPKTATPASYATAQAIGTSNDGS